MLDSAVVCGVYPGTGARWPGVLQSPLVACSRWRSMVRSNIESGQAALGAPLQDQDGI
ncbi:hypothetical protein GQ55_9G331500 [Panicum hallii var. hallii]|uniref:Uncharacterized protein n=1 Tax=Panicum hallii var. hallii TaxID=1504633 RepID=A0A2T7C8H7_9POAL|nr:hypothetical protein GQ55_9G331500 [Panicum hallii var. hallii]